MSNCMCGNIECSMYGCKINREKNFTYTYFPNAEQQEKLINILGDIKEELSTIRKYLEAW